MRSFLKSTRTILILSILAHAAGVVALLFSIGLLSFSDKKSDEQPTQVVVQTPQVEQPSEVGTSEAVPTTTPTPEPRPIEQPVVQKTKKIKKAAIKSEAEVEAEADAILPTPEPTDVKLVTPPPTVVAAKAPVRFEEDAKPVPVKEIPDGVAAQEAKDTDTEAKSKDVQENPEPATDTSETEKTSPSAI